MGRCTVVVFMLLFVCNMYGQQRFLSNHPRLLFTGAEEAAVKQLIQNNRLAGGVLESESGYIGDYSAETLFKG